MFDNCSKKQTIFDGQSIEEPCQLQFFQLGSVDYMCKPIAGEGFCVPQYARFSIHFKTEFPNFFRSRQLLQLVCEACGQVLPDKKRILAPSTN